MKIRNKKQLSDAFGIPQPQRKDEFIAENSDRLRHTAEVPRSPVRFIRYAAAGVCAAAMIALFANILHTPAPEKNFGGGTIITDTVMTTDDNENVTTAASSAVTETTAENSAYTNTTTFASTTGTVSDTTTSAVPTSAASTVSNTTAFSTSGTSTSTAAEKTATALTTTTGPVNQVTTTSFQAEAIPVTVTTHAEATAPGGKDRTVLPKVIYNTVIPENPNESTISPGSASELTPLSEVLLADCSVLRGTVLRTYYTSFDDIAYIQADIRADEICWGDTVNSFDLITFYIPVGWIENNNVQLAGTYFIPAVNSEYLLILQQTDSSLPDDTFQPREPLETAVFAPEQRGFTSVLAPDITLTFTDLEKLKEQP